MSTVVLRVETELDPSAAPRVFGYLGGLGHVPFKAALCRIDEATLAIEIQIALAEDAGQRISAKVGQMPFVLTSSIAPTSPGLDAAALRFAASQRGHAVRHRAQLNFNA